ncbi:MAG: hypothetical protein HKM06_02585 [Spirochaetales bacterium]|nr:hypothetical protein [Spirochaetales bacterium]
MSRLKGFATLAAVTFFVLALVILGGALTSSQQVLLSDRRVQKIASMRADAWGDVSRILTLLKTTWNADDQTFDQWQSAESKKFPAGTELISLSARLNLNSISPFLLQDSALINTLFGKTVPEFTGYRSLKGPFAHLGDYKDYFQPAALNQIYCVYSTFNVNTADEIMLEKVLAERLGSKSVAATIREALRGYRTNQQVLSDSDWDIVAGSEKDAIGVLVTTAPELDVNTASVPVLQAILEDPDLKVSQPDQKLQILVAGRNTKPWTPQSLASALNLDKKSLIMQYLGTRTHFIQGIIPEHEKQFKFVAWVAYSNDSPPDLTIRILKTQWIPS